MLQSLSSTGMAGQRNTGHTLTVLAVHYDQTYISNNVPIFYGEISPRQFGHIFVFWFVQLRILLPLPDLHFMYHGALTAAL